jgi:hypothetical protein
MQTGLSFFARLHWSVSVVCGCLRPTCASGPTPSARTCVRLPLLFSNAGPTMPSSIHRGSSSDRRSIGSCASPMTLSSSRPLPSCATGQRAPICGILWRRSISSKHQLPTFALLDRPRQPLPRRRRWRRRRQSVEGSIRRPLRAPCRRPHRCRLPLRRPRHRYPSSPDRRLHLP